MGNTESSSAIIDVRGPLEGCYTLAEVPGRRITKSLGLVEYTYGYPLGEMPNGSAGIFEKLLDTARESGANAVVNVRLTTGSYQRQGSQMQVTYVVAFGDAVILE